MKTDRHIRTWLGFALSTATLCALAEIVAAQIQVGPVTPPAGLDVEIRLGDGKRTSYHIGEVIPYALIFSATDHTKQWVSTEPPCEGTGLYPTAIPPNALATRDQKEVVEVTICTGHGWSKEIDLAQSPLIQTSILNRQYALDTPGSYELIWIGDSFGKQLTSNVVRLELMPRDPAWEAKQLARADAALDLGGENSEKGCEMLGYLGTPAAELDIARRYDGNNQCRRFREVLINAQDRSAVLRILEAKIEAPNEIINPEYLRTVAIVALYRANPVLYDGALHHQAPVQYAYSSLAEQETLRYIRRLVAALPSKQPYVRAQCIRNFAGYYALNTFSPGLPPDISDALRQQMPPVFRELSEADQSSTLQSVWPGISSPAMIPVLVGIIQNPTDTAREFALVRLFELDPKQARAFLMQQIAREPWRLSQVMPQLPDEPIPELDQVLLQHVMDGMTQPNSNETGYAIKVLSRFASAAVEPQVRALLDANLDKFHCDEQFDLMAYLHRTNPPAAEKFFERVQFGAWPCKVQNLATRYWSPAIERAELARLDANDPNEVRSALQDLKENASPAARPVILRHFENWNAAYRSKLDANGAFPSPPDPGAQLEGSYFWALAAAYGWNPSPEDVREYAKLCLTSDCRSRAEGAAAQLAVHQPVLIRISPVNTTPMTFALDQCGAVGNMGRLKGKISQYPKGTAFTIDARFHSAAVMDELVADLRPWMTAHGYEVSLYRDPQPVQ
jgi:hypothetical protein